MNTRVRPETDHLFHPGTLLGEELEVRGMSQRDLAKTMGRPAQLISEIVRGRRAITAETALQLDAALGTPAHVWVRLQAEYELALARRAHPALAKRVRRRAVAQGGR